MLAGHNYVIPVIDSYPSVLGSTVSSPSIWENWKKALTILWAMLKFCASPPNLPLPLLSSHLERRALTPQSWKSGRGKRTHSTDPSLPQILPPPTPLFALSSSSSLRSSIPLSRFLISAGFGVADSLLCAGARHPPLLSVCPCLSPRLSVQYLIPRRVESMCCTLTEQYIK